MPRSRAKLGSSNNIAAASISVAPVSLLDNIRRQSQSLMGRDYDAELNLDDVKATPAGWNCELTDWSDKPKSSGPPTAFPRSLRSAERKDAQAKERLFSLEHSTTNENIDRTTNAIDASQLSSTVSDLMAGRRDQAAYQEFLSILEQYSLHSSRDDQLEETIYHLMQAAVSFIRSNEQRFDPAKLLECYQRRQLSRTASSK